MSTTQLFFSAYFNVLGQNHRTIITNYNTFQTAFASLGALNDTTPITNTLGCILDDTGKIIFTQARTTAFSNLHQHIGILT